LAWNGFSTSSLECHAAYMSAAARAKIAMSEGSEAFQPLLGSSAAGMAYMWGPYALIRRQRIGAHGSCLTRNAAGILRLRFKALTAGKWLSGATRHSRVPGMEKQAYFQRHISKAAPASHCRLDSQRSPQCPQCSCLTASSVALFSTGWAYCRRMPPPPTCPDLAPLQPPFSATTLWSARSKVSTRCALSSATRGWPQCWNPRCADFRDCIGAPLRGLMGRCPDLEVGTTSSWPLRPA
jgi:hypothetical protein